MSQICTVADLYDREARALFCEKLRTRETDINRKNKTLRPVYYSIAYLTTLHYIVIIISY